MNRFNFGKTDKSSSDSHSFGDTWQSQSGKRGNRDRKNHFGKKSAKDGPRNQYREGDRGFSKFGRPQHKKRGPKAIKLNKALQYALKDNPIDMEDTIKKACRIMNPHKNVSKYLYSLDETADLSSIMTYLGIMNDF